MIKNHQWDRHYKWGILLCLVFVIALLIDFSWLSFAFAEVFVLAFFLGTEAMQFIGFVLSEIDRGVYWKLALKFWWKEKSFDTFGDLVADELGCHTGILVIIVFILTGKSIPSLFKPIEMKDGLKIIKK